MIAEKLTWLVLQCPADADLDAGLAVQPNVLKLLLEVLMLLHARLQEIV